MKEETVKRGISSFGFEGIPLGANGYGYYQVYYSFRPFSF